MNIKSSYNNVWKGVKHVISNSSNTTNTSLYNLSSRCKRINEPNDGCRRRRKRRIDIVTDALSLAIRQMVFRSTKGSRLLPRYKLSILAYSDHVFDLLGGVKTIDEVARLRPLEKSKRIV